MDLEIKLPLTSREAKVLFGVLDKYTDENYNEIASLKKLAMLLRKH